MSTRMSFDELKRFYSRVKLSIDHISGFDLVSHEWIFDERVFNEERAYSLVVLTFKNGHKLRVEIVPQTKPLFKISKKSVRDVHIWKTYFNVSLSSEEFEIIERLSQRMSEYFSLSDLLCSINSEIEKLQTLKKKLEKLQKDQ